MLGVLAEHWPVHASAGLQKLGTPSAHPRCTLGHAFAGRGEQLDQVHRVPPQIDRSLCRNTRLSMFCYELHMRGCVHKV